MAQLSAMQHRIAFLLLIASLAFAATTVFMLCLLQPKAQGTGLKSSKKINHSNGEDAYAALAGLPIRKRQLLDEAGSTDAFRQGVLQHGDAQRHGGSVLPKTTRKQLLNTGRHDALLDNPADMRTDRNDQPYAWQRTALRGDHAKPSTSPLARENLLHHSSDNDDGGGCCEDGRENEADRLLRIMSGLPDDSNEASAVNVHQAHQVALAAGLAPGFLLDVPYPARILRRNRAHL